MVDRHIERIARGMTDDRRTVEGLVRTQQVLRTIVNDRPVADALADQQEVADTVADQSETIDMLDSGTGVEEFDQAQDASDAAHDAFMDAVAASGVAADAFEGVSEALAEAQAALADAGLARSEAAQAVADASVATQNAAQAIQDALSAVELAEGAAPSWATVDPVSGDAAGKPAGAIWYVRDAAGRVLRMWELTPLGWVNRPFDETAIPQVAIGSGTYGTLSGARLVAKSVTAAQIQALAITAEELAAQAVTAAKIAANAVTAEKIAAGAIIAEKIAAGAITTAKLAATAIDGMTITGSLIRTAASGQRIQLDTQGLRAFNTNGVETATLYSDSGGFVMNGQIAVLKANGRPLVRMVADPAKFEALGYGGSIRIGTSPANAEIGASGTIMSDAESGLYIAAGNDLVVRASETARFFGIGSTIVASSTNVRVSAPDIYLDGPVRFSTDTDWTDIRIRPGFSAQSSDEVPQVRVKGGALFMRGLFSNQGLSANGNFTVGDFPTQPINFAPPRNMQLPAGTNSGAATGQMFLAAAGTIQIRTGATLSAYYGFGSPAWPK